MPHGDIETVHHDGSWHNVVEGARDQVSEPFATREEAVAEGREMAKDLGVEHIIKNPDGSVEERSSSGDAPAGSAD